MRTVTITSFEKGQRLDRFLRKYLHTASRTLIFKLLRTRKIKVNKKKAQPEDILDTDDLIEIYLKEEDFPQSRTTFREDFRQSNISLEKKHILYETDDEIVLNKPAGKGVHGETNSFLNMLLSYLGKKYMTETFRPAFVHRLDKETSGVILAGKTPAAVRYYTAEFAERNTQKKYYALVKGILSKKEGSIEKSLLKEGKRTSLSDDGKKALTTYEVSEEYGIKATLVKVQIHTGRMHQIRAHFASIGHGVIGDRQYGDRRINDLFREKYGLKRLFLHAYELTFKDMKGRIIKKRAPLAVELQEVLDLCKN